MDYDYFRVIELRGELEQFKGYLDAEGLKQQNTVKAAYQAERNKLVYQLIGDLADADEAVARVDADLDACKEVNPGWALTVDVVREDINNRIRGEAGKPVWRRRLQYYSVPIIVSTLAIAYVGTWMYNDLEIDQPIETKAGIIQRADALDKVLRYQDLMSGQAQRGGWIKPFLFAPLEPDDAELEGARGFSSLVLAGYDKLESEGLACDLAKSIPAEAPTEAELELLEHASAYVHDPVVQWREPPPMTLLDAVIKDRPCKNLPITVAAPSL